MNGPVEAQDRVVLMDMLRGVALFGVFLVNFVEFASPGVMSTELQVLSLPTAALDLTLREIVVWLASDKANTLFACLFGLGFYLQMSRLEARGAEAERIYRRRLTVLLLFGVLNNFLLWPWDILHLYALAGFILLAMRHVSNRALVVVGVLLALFGRTAIKAPVEWSVGGADVLPHAIEMFDNYSDEGALLRQSLSDSYGGLVSHFFTVTMVDYVLAGFLLGWLAHSLGRFFIGAWVGRREWITRAADFLPGWRRVMRWTLPGGLLLEGVAVLVRESPLLPEWQYRWFAGLSLHLAAAPVLATGYVSALVVAFHGPTGRRLLTPFAWSGRMALTNYLMQGAIIGLVMFGVGPGLALAGKIGTTAIVGIVIAAYAAQVAFSRWWLGRFTYGPMEWIWRALTYGERPPLRSRPVPDC